MKRFLVLLIFSMFGLAAVRAQDSVVLQEEDENKIFDVVEQMPEYPEGMAALLKFISNNLKVPKELESEDLIPSKVAASFIVEKDGSITDIKITKSVHPLLDAEYVRVIGLIPKWNPGMKDGKSVRVRCSIPMLFHFQY